MLRRQDGIVCRDRLQVTVTVSCHALQGIADDSEIFQHVKDHGKFLVTHWKESVSKKSIAKNHAACDELEFWSEGYF